MAYLLNPGGESDNLSIPLGTRKTRHIANEARHEWSPDRLQQDLARCLIEFPNLEVRSVTATYNCIGMVFASRRTWVDPSQVSTFLSDDEYTRLPTIQDAKVGDVVIYRMQSGEIGHVGIVIHREENLRDSTVKLKILSKWGPWAEFIHDPSDCYGSWGQLSEAWTDRKIP